MRRIITVQFWAKLEDDLTASNEVGKLPVDTVAKRYQVSTSTLDKAATRDNKRHLFQSWQDRYDNYIIDGVRDSILGHAIRYRVNAQTVYSRMYRGSTLKQALRLPATAVVTHANGTPEQAGPDRSLEHNPAASSWLSARW